MNLSVPFNWNFLRSTAILFEKIDGLPTTIDEPLATFSSLSAVVERIGDYAQLRKPAARGTRKHALARIIREDRSEGVSGDMASPRRLLSA
jgi:hypothetical protein